MPRKPPDFSASAAPLVGDREVGNAELADLLGLLPNSLSRLAAQGTIPKLAKGRYHLREAVLAYVAHLKKGSETPLSGLDEEEQRVRIAERKLKVRKMEGEVVDAGVMERGVVERARRGRDEIQQAPAKMAPRGAAKFDVDLVKLRAWLDDEMHALSERVAEAVRLPREADEGEHAA